MQERLLKLLARVLKVPADKITLASSPDTLEGWDSLAHMNLVVALEDEFKISFTAEEIVSLLSVEIIVATLKEKGVQG